MEFLLLVLGIVGILLLIGLAEALTPGGRQ